MSSEKITEIMRSWFTDGLNQEKWTEVRGLFSDDFVYHGAERDFTFDELRAQVSDYRGRHPDLVFGIDRVVSHGNAVGVSWHASAKHGTTFGIGRGTMTDGQIKEIWAVMPNL